MILFQIVTQQKALFEGVYLLSAVLVNTYTVIIIYEAFSKTRGCACELLACSPNFCFSSVITNVYVLEETQLTSVGGHKMW